jgi:cytochrome c5
MRHVLKLAIAGVALLTVAPAAWADGQAVYKANCAPCHNNMKPKLGDKAAWAPLVAQGTDALVASTIKGKGAMPPRGGKPGLSDDDIKAATEYMVGAAK